MNHLRFQEIARGSSTSFFEPDCKFTYEHSTLSVTRLLCSGGMHARAVRSSSSLPLQMAVYYNIIFSFIFFLFQMSVHIQKVGSAGYFQIRIKFSLLSVKRLLCCDLQRYTYRYSETMRIIVPILIAGFGLCEGLRLYLGFSGNLMERVRTQPTAASAARYLLHICRYQVYPLSCY